MLRNLKILKDDLTGLRRVHRARPGVRGEETCQDLGVSREETAERICKKFSISEEEAEKNLEKYWK